VPGTPHAQTLDEIFGPGSWRTEVIGDGVDERLDRAIHGARYWRQVDVRRANGDRWPGYWYVCSTSQTLTMDET